MPILVLHNIRSAHNVGSMFRTADGAGVGRIILSGYTPDHLDPKGKERRDFVKVSLGAEKFVPHERAKQLSAALKKLKAEGYTIVAVELTDSAVNIFDYTPHKDAKLAIVMGNEVRGINKQNLKYCDAVVMIPMRGKKESLNVGVACGIALFTLLR
ncbi:MAG TPA: TrmH family RNA methyltransferase [Candidatus Paceibacterota bacterium]|jgi:tRNA G18 (ribose-2'-O)-methylase SpoU|nr:TrmH family RNA methyltransferase [Candidatus Paceibacterota bacterium]